MKTQTNAKQKTTKQNRNHFEYFRLNIFPYFVYDVFA